MNEMKRTSACFIPKEQKENNETKGFDFSLWIVHLLSMKKTYDDIFSFFFFHFFSLTSYLIYFTSVKSALCTSFHLRTQRQFYQSPFPSTKVIFSQTQSHLLIDYGTPR